MVDITMCFNHTCPSRSNCYRATAKAGEWQSYSVFHPDEHGRCKHYIKPDIVYDLEKKK